jgi:hypothetical protein
VKENNKKPDLHQQVEQEIRDHSKTWCHKKCDTFLPSCYREHRIIREHSVEEVQNNYDWCHIFR